MNDDSLWRGLTENARRRLTRRNYQARSLEERITLEGLESGVALASETRLREAGAWIPGVELIHRAVYPQRHRGWFSELGRQEEGRLGEIQLWPRQWAVARMFAGSAKGFHIHPPYIPEGETPEGWFQQLFTAEEPNYQLRPYDREQWDVMYFLQGRLDLYLRDERAGLPSRVMRLFIDGDDRRGANNTTVIIPAGVAHALRAEGSEDLMMVYGTTTVFDPANEGRISSDVEEMPLPPGWDDYLSSDSR